MMHTKLVLEGPLVITIVRPDRANAGEIARLYISSFPDSIEFFFGPDYPPSELQNVCTWGFDFLLHGGCQPVLAIDQQGRYLGYCLVGSGDILSGRRMLHGRSVSALTVSALNLVRRLTLRRAAKLASNWVRLSVSEADRACEPQPMRYSGRIISIAVDPCARGRGIGRQLLRSALDYCAAQGYGAVYLEVRPENTPAKKLYEDLGFTSYGTSRDLQGTWVRMVRT